MGKEVVNYGSAVNDGTGDPAHVAAAKIDAGARLFGVIDKDLTAPPGTPAIGDCYIVGASATGDWATHDGKIAVYGLGATWRFIAPNEGIFAYLRDEDTLYVHNGSSWGIYSPSSSAGKQTIWIPASAMVAATTSGPASAQVETTTNKINVPVLDFDASADEYAHFHIAFPKSWDEGTVTYKVWWTTTATGTTGVAWGLEAVALSDSEAIDTAWGTAVVVTDDAQSAASEMLITAESSAVTIGGTPAEGDLCFFRIFRDVSDANDDMTEDARLIGIQLYFTTNTANDA